MDEHGFQFRTAFIGGFQKQDVMAYLEKSARDHAQRVAQLQKQLEEARSAITSDGETQQAQSQRIAALEEDNQRLAQAVAEAEELRARVAALEAEVARLSPAATAYEAVREKAANIELDAHTRAQAIERQSREKIQQDREQVKQWFAQIRSRYEQLRQEVMGSLAQGIQGMEQATKTLQGMDLGLDELAAQVGAGDAVKPPVPLSVDAPAESPAPPPAPTTRELW